jgi:hypothetical protein
MIDLSLTRIVKTPSWNEWLLTGLTTAATDELFRAHATVKSGRRGEEECRRACRRSERIRMRTFNPAIVADLDEGFAGLIKQAGAQQFSPSS